MYCCTGIVSFSLQDISALSLVVTQKGEADIPGLTDVQVPKRLGPKRANKIRALFHLTKEDDVRKYVIRREVPSKKEGKTNSKVLFSTLADTLGSKDPTTCYPFDSSTQASLEGCQEEQH